MKQLLLLILIVISLSSVGQITIVKGDMPSANDSIRMSKALNMQNYDFTVTDTNYNWDFSSLTPLSQRVERFIGKSDFPLLYLAVFFTKSNLASERDDMNLLNITIENGYNFYKNSNSSFKQVGYGAEVNGIPTPVSFTNADYIYRFPMAYGNQDSCLSKWNISIPSLATVKEWKKRVNHIDGWGSITTPYGTFQCIRIKSEIQQMDSISYSTGGINLGVPQNYTEYTWYSKSLPFPILKATVSMGGLLSTIEYSDSVRQFVGIETSKINQADVNIYPNPSSSNFVIEFKSKAENNSLQIIDLNGRIVYQEDISNNYHKVYSKNRFAKGIYIVRIISNNNSINKKLIIQ